MIFAAGVGSRLDPITREKPKALVEVAGKTMLEHTLDHLQQYGVRSVMINLHHFPGQIKAFVQKHAHFGMNIVYSEENQRLLDTGGGLKKAAWFFDQGKPFIIHNVDVLSDLDLGRLYRYHQEHQALATLAVRARTTSRYLLVDSDNRLCGRENTKNAAQEMVFPARSWSRWAFSGIHIADPGLFNLMPQKEVFSIMELYLKAAAHKRIQTYPDNGGYWFDIGTPEKLRQARAFLNPT